MSRFLFVVPPMAGHITPTVGVGIALAERGHEVAWCGIPEAVRPRIGPIFPIFACAAPRLGEPAAELPAEMRGAAAVRFLWESFLVPLAEAMVPGVAAGVDAFAPDVLVADQLALAGALVASARGIPWVTSAAAFASLLDPLASARKVEAWLGPMLERLAARAGSTATTAQLRSSPYQVLSSGSAAAALCLSRLAESRRETRR
jgi:UDP:flavonoid glycosyltransferase YjiC (YdhE family)